MNLDKIMKNMGLSQEEKDYIKRNHENKITSNVKAVWQVIEDAGSYG